MAAIATVDAAPFTLIFAGGTALARAHKLVRRMSEDVDFKIVPAGSDAISKNKLRQQLSALRASVTTALQAAGFPCDPEDGARISSSNKNRYTIYHLPYGQSDDVDHDLRPTIQIELTYAPLRLASVVYPVHSFIAEAFGREPELAAISCVNVTETAAEKFVALTRRIAMELAGLSRAPDPTLVRHIYDLHLIRERIDPAEVARLARAIAIADSQEFENQYPAYAADPAGETSKALAAIEQDPTYRQRYASFILNMVYGEQPDFDTAFASVKALAALFAQE